MHVSDQYILRQVADEYLLIPTGEAALRVRGLISLSESGYLLYQLLQTGCSRQELIAALLREYDVAEAQAAGDVDAFLERMRRLEILTGDGL